MGCKMPLRNTTGALRTLKRYPKGDNSSRNRSYRPSIKVAIADVDEDPSASEIA